MKVARGRFITFEGIEGVGKTTQLGELAARLRRAGVDVATTREPGGTDTAERIREVLLAPEQTDPLTPLAELLLMFAARDVHTRNLIEPALARGTWVLCDRYTDATSAYQGAGRGAPGERIDLLADWVHGRCWPDCTLLLDAPVEVGLTRARARAADAPADRFEREAAVFFERVRTRYLQLAEAAPERFVIIDATREPDQVAEAVCRAVVERFGVALRPAEAGEGGAAARAGDGHDGD